MHVAQQREGQAAGTRERLVTERAVSADGDQGRAPLAELAGDLTQVAKLGRSDATEVIAVEREHDIGLPPEVGERDRAPACHGQAEVGRKLAEPERHGGQCTPNRARSPPAT